MFSILANRVMTSQCTRYAIKSVVNNNTSVLSQLSLRSFSSELQKGSVKWFDTKKGYGFIGPDDGSPDVFVHQTQIHAEGFRSLAEGENVEYVVITDPNTGKTKAERVTGPNGGFVEGAPRNDFGEFFGRGDGDNRFRGGGGGGFPQDGGFRYGDGDKY